MKKFAFKLAALLKLRERHRDLCLQLLAQAMRRDEELLALRKQAETDRASQFDEIRDLTDVGEVDVDGAATRRFYAGQLIGDIGGIERQRTLVAHQIAACRQKLILADQGVKALEKLQEKQLADFRFVQDRREERELEECFRTAGAGGKF